MKTESSQLPNRERMQIAERLVATINRIIKSPESWDQQSWHCESTHCFFGHADILAGFATEERINAGALDAGRVREWLGITEQTGTQLSDTRAPFYKLYFLVQGAARGMAVVEAYQSTEAKRKALGFQALDLYAYGETDPGKYPLMKAPREVFADANGWIAFRDLEPEGGETIEAIRWNPLRMDFDRMPPTPYLQRQGRVGQWILRVDDSLLANMFWRPWAGDPILRGGQ